MRSPDNSRSQPCVSNLDCVQIHVLHQGPVFAHYLINGIIQAEISLVDDAVSVHILSEGTASWILSDMTAAGQFLHSYFGL